MSSGGRKVYEGVLTEISVASRDDSIMELIAKAIINVMATSERDPKVVMGRARTAQALSPLVSGTRVLFRE